MSIELIVKTRMTTYNKERGRSRDIWYLETKDMGVHLWIEHPTVIGPNSNSYGGIEIHNWDGDGKPHHQHCEFTGRPCWTDGSSLAAEPFARIYEAGGKLDDETAFAEVERWLYARTKGKPSNV